MEMRYTFTLLFFLLIIIVPKESLTQDQITSNAEDQFKGIYTIRDDGFAIWNGREYIPIFIKGINMGVSVPGTQPGQLAATREDYRRWFDLIKEAGYNTIRLYTLHYPRFYEELKQYNLDHPGSPLLVIQGIWLEEQETARDLFELTTVFSNEIREVVSAVHGDIAIDQRFGKAYGIFSADISSWVAGFLAGREIFPEEVSLTNQNHPGENVYQGTYFQLSGGGDPVEVWIIRQLDSLMIFEMEHYRTVRPAGFSNWPTLDPLFHPTEHFADGSQEDVEKIDLANVVSTDSSAGFFIGFHAYPYYPDFIIRDPYYSVETDSLGPNGYLGYLKDLKQHYDGIPLVVAEFGVPSSWGSGHHSPTGMHHGGLTEEQQGKYAIRMLDNIVESGCAGGIQFSLIDEWFKQTWITNPYSSKEYRHLWHNITSPEQNFGILSYASPPEPYTVSGSYPDKSISQIKTSSDYAFFRTRFYLDVENHQGDTLWVAFDTYEKDLGESVLPNGKSLGGGTDTLRAEFVLCIPLNGERADLYVIPSYDVYGIKNMVRVDTVISTSTDLGEWHRVRWKNSYDYNTTQYIGELRISGLNDPYQFLNAVTLFKDSLEVRIPWTLINFPAPTVRRAMHYVSRLDGSDIVIEREDTLSEGIAITAVMNNELYQAERYSWSFWDHEKIAEDPPIERKKQSYHYLKRHLPLFNSPPIGLADTFELEPGSILDMGEQDGLLGNDFDIDGNEFFASLSFGNGTTNGDLHLHPNGSFNYIPDPGFMGNDFFMYYLHDGYTYSTLVPVYLKVGFALNLEENRQNSNNRFSIVPNPGKELFHIRTTILFRSASLRVVDMMGREVAFETLEDSDSWIRLEDLEPGVFIFSIQFDNNLELHRIIIQ